MHVEQIEFDGFPPATGAAAPLESDADPWAEGPLPGTVSLIARGGQIRVTLTSARTGPRHALIAAIRQMLRMPEYRSGAERLTFAPVLPAEGLGHRAAPREPPKVE